MSFSNYFMADSAALESAVAQLLLTTAGSHSADAAAASQQLASWAQQPRFNISLMAFLEATHGSPDPEAISARLIAVTMLKNAATRYWRPTAPNAIPEDQKAELRSRLGLLLTEPVPRVAAQAAVLIGQIARTDVPREWPQLMPALLENLRSTDANIRRGSLLFLHHVTKTIAHKHLPHDRRYFQQLTAEILPFLVSIFVPEFESTIQQLQTADAEPPEMTPQLLISLQFTRMSLKLMRTLLTHGVTDLQPEHIQQIFQQLCKHLPSLLAVYDKLADHEDDELDTAVFKCIKTICKIFLDVFSHSAIQFRIYLHACLDTILTHVILDEQPKKRPIPSKILLPAFLFVKEVIGFDFSDLNPTLRMDQSLQALADEAMAVRNAYFTPDVVLQLFSGIFRRFLVFSPEEEEAWTETPETVAIEEVGEGWQYVLKPCAEKVAKTIITKYHDVVAPRLVALVGESQNPVERESLYNCVHLGGYGLYDEVPFDDWLPALTREYMDAKPHEHLAPLRRRILLLVTHWMDIRLADSARPLVYELIVNALASDPHPVVRLTAAVVFPACVDVPRLDVQQLQPYLTTALEHLFSLMANATQADTKLRILSGVTRVFSALHIHVRDYAESVAQLLPQLWNDAQAEPMMQSKTLELVQIVVENLGSRSSVLHPMLIPLIMYGTDVTQPAHEYLVEVALILWRYTLKNAPSLTPELVEMMARLSSMLERADSGLKACVQILGLYLLLDDQQVLLPQLPNFAAAAENLVGTVPNNALHLVHNIIDEMILLYGRSGAQALFNFLVQTWLLLIAEQPPTSTFLSLYAGLWCRVWMQCPDVVYAAAEQLISQGITDPFDRMWVRLFDSTDAIAEPKWRKLIVLAAGQALVDHKQQPILQRIFGLVVNCFVSSIATFHKGIYDGTGDALEVDYLVVEDRDPGSSSVEDLLDPEASRKAQMAKRDPIYTQSVRQFIAARLEEFQAQHSQEALQILMSTVEPVLVQQLTAMLNPAPAPAVA